MRVQWFIRKANYRYERNPVVASEGRDFKQAVLEHGLLYVQWMGGEVTCYPLTQVIELLPYVEEWPFAR